MAPFSAGHFNNGLYLQISDANADIRYQILPLFEGFWVKIFGQAPTYNSHGVVAATAARWRLQRRSGGYSGVGAATAA
ncbi:hypothetical protein GNI_074470 [Gregarina niphandrodes]|uniref:Uncharacterized protein n=1 Tax=Gregarina niphandrodes TaxID=110365 RepID=A0A023B719_GRENI|nr:hypothetical protein GNI_074470 [Gregarina niphandrodes]EZG66887.1 hypothetical protein GNI_074470 [Gregarina niphandrodes]|eukprot:XP_011130445.1 hypothetical protein GNI_074470 [Gregarina niphandrodes]